MDATVKIKKITSLALPEICT